MIVYNVTTKITWEIKNDWIDWIKNEHIPQLINTGCFTHATVLHLLEADDEEGTTYVVQYFSASKDDYNEYINIHAETFRNAAFAKWGDKFISFRTVMQVVN